MGCSISIIHEIRNEVRKEIDRAEEERRRQYRNRWIHEEE